MQAKGIRYGKPKFESSGRQNRKLNFSAFRNPRPVGENGQRTIHLVCMVLYHYIKEKFESSGPRNRKLNFSMLRNPKPVGENGQGTIHFNARVFYQCPGPAHSPNLCSYPQTCSIRTVNPPGNLTSQCCTLAQRPFPPYEAMLTLNSRLRVTFFSWPLPTFQHCIKGDGVH